MTWFSREILQEPSLPWVAVRTRVRSKKQVARVLSHSGIECWAPTALIRRRWTDRWKSIAWPLFPGYVFARVPADGWYPLLNIQGIFTVVKSGKRAAEIDMATLGDVRRFAEGLGKLAEQPEHIPWYAPGDLVLVTDGPFTGVRALVTYVDGRRRVAIGMTLLGQGVSVLLPSAQLSRIPA